MQEQINIIAIIASCSISIKVLGSSIKQENTRDNTKRERKRTNLLRSNPGVIQNKLQTNYCTNKTVQQGYEIQKPIY